MIKDNHRMFMFEYFLLSLIIFLEFFVLITLLGFFFQYYLFKKFKSKKITLKIILESFGVGTAVFILYCYIIIDFLRVFNFFTIYVPLLAFNTLSILYYCFKHDCYKIEKFRVLLFKIQVFSANKQFKRHLAMLIIIFSLFLLVQGVIETNLSLPAKDPYNWLELILYLHKYGDLNYEDYTVHGVGFIVFVAASLLITNEFYIQYFFIKYISTFLFLIIILAMYDITRQIFKKELEIMISLVVLLCFNSLLYRFSLAVPSVLATTLGVIFFNTLIQNESKRIFLIRGILLGGIFLIHPLYFLFLFGLLISYELIKLIKDINNNFKREDFFITKRLINFIKKNGILLIITLIFSAPYFLNLYFSDKNLYENYTRYLFRGYSANILNPLNYSLSFSTNVFIILNFKPSRTNIVFNLIYIGLDIPINKTLNWGVLFLIFGLFHDIKLENNQQKYLIDFAKITFIFTSLMFIMVSFLFVSNNLIILSIASFINQYGYRIFELFSPLWTLLFVMGLSTLIQYFEKIKVNKIKGYEITRELSIAKIKSKCEKYYLIVLIIAGTCIYASHLYLHYNIIYSTHYDDDHLTEALLFIGDYFNEEDIEDETILLPDNFDSKVIYRLIYHRNCEREYIEFDDTNHTELEKAIEENDADFVLVYKLETRDSCLEIIEEDEDILYENPHFLFFKTDN